MASNAAGGRAGRGGGAVGGRGAGGRGGPAARAPWKGPMDPPSGGAGAGRGNVANAQENKPPSYVQESLQATLPSFKKAVHVGDRVIDKHSKREGICLYVGPAEFAKGKEVCGLRLDKKRSTTDCDGKYRGERYFRCTSGHGLYIPLEDAEYQGPGGDDDFAHMQNAAEGRRASDGPPKGKQLPRGDDNGGGAVDPNFDLEKELEPIVGLTEVKDMLRGISNAVEVRKKREGMGVNDERTMHMLFLGNPGTGKTTVARLVARMLHSLGILKKGQLIEVTRKDLIGSHHGETASLTADACKRALGGVLFIDEAYALRAEGSSDSAGQECVNTLVKEAEEHTSDLVIILAGYNKEMASFVASNSGLSSRFPNVFNFADYTSEEMAGILKSVAIEKGFTLADDLAHDQLVAMVKRSVKAGEAAKGNGRLIKNMVEAAIARQTNRVFQMGTVTRGTLTTLIEDDFGEADSNAQGLESVPEVLAKLDKIVGLDNVKVFTRQLVAQLQMRAQRLEAGLPVPADASLHMIFTGNPGTGKTTVARIVAAAFKSLGILRLGHLVECDRASLVAGYAGQTAIKTKQLIDTALGGILFVDEAYALVSDSRDTFGKEALDTLMKATEDFRDDLVVILAGYPGDMTTLLSRNPGLKSRFATTIEFPDYSADELMHIATVMLDAEMLTLSDDAHHALMSIFTIMATVHDRENGNGRAVRNLLERAKRAQALRLMELGGKRSREELSLLTEEDFMDSLAEMRPLQLKAGGGGGQDGGGDEYYPVAQQ
jgi:SpoVK/Ycf46/Vps4 family AAA+-type ATPase